MGRRKLPKRPRNSTEYKFRLALPQRLVKCIWEFSIHKCDNAWTFQLKPVNIRPARTYAFDFVRTGDVSAVRELLRSRQLSVQDRESSWRGSGTLLDVSDVGGGPHSLSPNQLAYHYQMAACNGHLELCKFLLRETSFPADNASLSSALEEVQRHAWSSYQGTDDLLLEAFYRLFVSEHNLEIDLLDPPTCLEDICQLTHTKTSFGVVLASQPTSFADLSLAKKFSATIEAVGWPADAFATMLNHHNSSEVVTRTAEDGKTALHWAAAHLGEWLRSVEGSRFETAFSHRVEPYATLASDLVRVGADVHALWHDKAEWSYDPFLAFLKGVDLITTYTWDRAGMAKAARVWGRVLVEGGVHLDSYIITENELLRSIKWSDWFGMDIPSLGIYDSSRLVPKKLCITKDSTLAVEILEIPCVMVWRAQEKYIPGAWPIPHLFVDTIIWHPRAMEECDGFCWVISDRIHIKPGRKQIDALGMSGGSDELVNDSIIGSELGHSESHDDHSPVAMVLGRETRSRQRVSWRHSSGLRTSSAPPLHDHTARSEIDWTNRTIYMHSGWRFTAHKCPLDSRWYKRPLNFVYNNFRRYCMQGRCRELQYSDEENDAATFEGWLLRNEDHVHVVKRYAQKFCPERMHIVEATLERVTDRARLAMGPKRPGDAGIP
jgi:hypothetical protein